MTQPFERNFYTTLKVRHQVIKAIRYFFNTRGYIEVDTPLRVRCPGIEPYIDAIEAGDGGFYLATSPELQMKRLLNVTVRRIYQITHAFRADEMGPLHNSEFTLLEWYRVDTDYFGIMEETELLLKHVLENVSFHGKDLPVYTFPFQRLTVNEVFKETAGWEPSTCWDEDKYFLDWIEKVEPFLSSFGCVFIYDFPAPLAMMSKLHTNNPTVCQRFELFMNGVEIANAFTELTDPEEQKNRFLSALEKRKKMGKPLYEIDEKFLDALRTGIPDCAGIAVGIDRLLMALLGYKDIAMVQAFPQSRL